MPGAARRPRGFTLIELMVSSVITVTIMAAVATTFIAVQGAYQSEAQVKGAVENGRTALGYLERTVALAGYGLPPEMAFDFDETSPYLKDNVVDAAADFVTDDLAIRFRDPLFLRRGTTDGTTVTLDSGDFGVALRPGQGMIVACRGGRSFALLRTTNTSDTAATATSVGVASFYTPPGVATDDRCFTDTGEAAPFVMLMHERRFRVVSLSGRSFLVVFHNHRAPDPTTNTDFEPLASDVEEFQVAYGMNRPSAVMDCCSSTTAIDSGGNSNWMLMDAASETVPSELNPPTYSTPYNDPARFTNSNANIRSVRVSMVLRSTGDREERRISPRMSLENAPAWTVPQDGFYRYALRTTVRTPNLNSRSFFTPPIRMAGADDDELNFTGG